MITLILHTPYNTFIQHSSYYIYIQSSRVPYQINMSLLIDNSKILDGLYLGNLISVKDYKFLVMNNIQYILSLTTNYVPIAKQDINHLQFKITDTPHQDIITLFDVCNQYINYALSKGVGIYVHCDAGVSRSSSIVIAYLMKKYNKTFELPYRFL